MARRLREIGQRCPECHSWRITQENGKIAVLPSKRVMERFWRFTMASCDCASILTAAWRDELGMAVLNPEERERRRGGLSPLDYLDAKHDGKYVP